MKYTKEDCQKLIELINDKTNQKYLLMIDHYLGKYSIKAYNVNPLENTHPQLTKWMKLRELYYCLETMNNTLIYLK